MAGITVQPNEITEVLNRPISQELLARDLARLAYVARDGTPRTIPIAFTWPPSATGLSPTTASGRSGPPSEADFGWAAAVDRPE
jgi:hypothetical protein